MPKKPPHTDPPEPEVPAWLRALDDAAPAEPDHYLISVALPRALYQQLLDRAAGDVARVEQLAAALLASALATGPSLDLYTGGATDLPAGEYALYALDAEAQAADGSAVWIAQTLAVNVASLDRAPAEAAPLVAAAALLRFAGAGARWIAPPDCTFVAVEPWPAPRRPKPPRR